MPELTHMLSFLSFVYEEYGKEFFEFGAILALMGCMVFLAGDIATEIMENKK